jgi:hypothetical protein
MSSQLLTPVAGPFDETVVPSQGCDCRVYERHSCGLASRCQPASSFGKENLKWSGTIDNVSIGGVGLTLERRFEKGTGLAIELPGSAGNGSYVVLAKVVHVMRNSNGLWTLGCKFVSELSEDEVQRLLPDTRNTAAPTPSDDTPLPLADIESSQTIPTITSTTKPKTVPVHLVVETAAGKTVGFSIPRFGAFGGAWPLAAGTVGSIKGTNRTGNSWNLRIKVSQCFFDGDRWNLECRLAKSTPEVELFSALEAYQPT